MGLQKLVLEAIWRGAQASAGAKQLAKDVESIGAAGGKASKLLEGVGGKIGDFYAKIGGAVGVLRGAGVFAAVAAGARVATAGLAALEEELEGLSRAKISIEGLGSTLAPLEALEARVVALQKATRYSSSSLYAAFADLSTETKDVAGSIERLSLVADVARAKGISLQAAQKKVAEAMVDGADAVAELERRYAGAASRANGLGDANDKLANAFKRAKKEAAELLSLGEIVTASKTGLAGVLQSIADQLDLIKKRFDALRAGGGIVLNNGGLSVAPPASSGGNVPGWVWSALFQSPGNLGPAPTGPIQGPESWDDVLGRTWAPGLIDESNTRWRRGRRPSIRGREDRLDRLSARFDGADDEFERRNRAALKAGEQYSDAVRKADEDRRKRELEMGRLIQSTILEAFEASRGGVDGFAEYVGRKLGSELKTVFSGLLTMFLTHGAAGDLGLFGKVFQIGGGGGTSTGARGAITDNLARRIARVGA